MSRLPLESSGKLLFQVSYQVYPIFILYMHFPLHYAHLSVEVTVDAVADVLYVRSCENGRGEGL